MALTTWGWGLLVVMVLDAREQETRCEGDKKSIFSLCYLSPNPFSSTTVGDENPIRTLGDYSKPSHEGYKNTIELPVGNNVVTRGMEGKVDTSWKEANHHKWEEAKNCIWNRTATTLLYQLSSEPSRQEEFEDLVMNFILNQEEKVRQLKEYMCVIGSDFMQLSLEVVGKLRGEIRIDQNRTKKIKKITRYPDTKDLKPLNDHKFSETLTKEGQDSPDGVKRPDRKAHLLEDKQIPSVGVFDEVFCIWKAFGRNTRDFGSFGEETDKTMDLHQHCSRISPPKLETASQITRDAVTTISKTALQDIKTTSQDLKTALELQRLNNHTPEEDQIDQEDGDDEDAGDHETDQTPDLTDYQLARDRERRTRTKPLRFQDESNMAAYAFAAAEEEDTHEPLTYQEAVACEDSSKWKAAMEEEMDSLRKNKTWELVDHPAGQKLVSCKWLFKIKEGIEGVQKPRYKARLVARGFTQRACIDYNEVFSLVVRHTSIRVILALTACKDYELEQLDVKTAFLHGNLEEVIYMRQPPGYEQGNKVCLLKKSLYGLKQSPRQWYKRFDEYMLSNGFKHSSYDSCVYYRSYAPGEYIYLLLYVDDMLIACKSKAEIGSTKSLLKKEFDMKELGEAKKILGMEIVRDQSRKILRVSQSGYVSKILNNFRIDNGKSVKMPLGGHFKLSLKDCPVRDCDVERMSKVPYANAVGSLMYLMVCTRPDIAYAVSVVSRYLANPGKNHWEAVKWILKYLRGTANVGLVHEPNHGKHVDVTSFANSDYAKDPDKGRSITGYAFLVQGCVVSWKATLQHMVALSTTEAEYMALTKAVNEAIWLRGLLEELGVELNTVAVNCDNQGAIHLSHNHIFHERTKHINVRYHLIREVLEAKIVKVLKVGTEHNATDALTKVVPGLKLQHCLVLLNVGVG
ncbi:retrotransposon protein, putative, ty1-copia subclass [Tanacetum coccineum]